MSNMKLFVLSTSMLMLGIADASAHPLIYAWGGHFSESNGGRAYAINPIAATVFALGDGSGGTGRGGGSGSGGSSYGQSSGGGGGWGGSGGSGGGALSGGGGSGGGAFSGGGTGGSARHGAFGPSHSNVDDDPGQPDGPVVFNPPVFPPDDPDQDPQYPMPTFDDPIDFPPGGPDDKSFVYDPSTSITGSVPEPASLGLIAVALAALGARFRRRKS